MMEILLTAIKAAIEAGEAILDVYKKDFEVDFKEDASPLTEADLLSNKIIVNGLLKTNIPIISEEEKEVPYVIRNKWSQCWIIDPVDGTKEFIKKNGEFTVNISLVENGITKLGVIYVPVTRELYYTDEKKSKSYKSIIDFSELANIQEELFKSIDEIRPSVNEVSSIKVVGSRSHMNDDTLSFVNSLKKEFDKVEVVSKGSSLKFCLVAEGKADVYPRFAPTMEWDTAAGQAICEAVGLRIIDKKTNKNMVYNRKKLLNNYFLVTK